MTMNASKLLLSLSILMLCGCNGSRTSDSRDAIDSLTDASATVDTVIDAKADTVCVDSLEKESEEDEEHLGDEYGYVTTWHDLTKTLYEVEFCDHKLKQDITRYIDSMEKRSSFLAEANYFVLSISKITGTHAESGERFVKTAVSIDAKHVDSVVWLGAYFVNGTHHTTNKPINPTNDILGYSIFGRRIAIVCKMPFAVDTKNNPMQFDFRWAVETKVDPNPRKVRIDAINDEGWYGFSISQDEYMPCDSLSIEEYENDKND